MVDICVERLTLGEKLLISRRRENLTQEEMATIYGVTRNIYGEMERDQRKVPDYKGGEIEPLRDHEKLLLARRRAEMKQDEVAKEIGVSRYWLNQMEMGKFPLAEKFVTFWEGHYERK